MFLVSVKTIAFAVCSIDRSHSATSSLVGNVNLESEGGAVQSTVQQLRWKDWRDVEPRHL